MSVIIGHTGTRDGHTFAQHNKLGDYLESMGLHNEIQAVHHGMCVGSDAEFHELCRQLFPAARIHGWPASDVDPKWRADLDVDILHDEFPALKRNHFIVDWSEYMSGCPAQKSNVPRGSGTWATIRYAKRVHRPICVVFPDGSYELAPSEPVLG